MSLRVERSVRQKNLFVLVALVFASCDIQFGLRQGDACQPADDPATCNGNVLEFCDPDLLVTLRQTCPEDTTCDAAQGECLPAIVPPLCGDGISGNTTGEECDEGNNNSDTTPNACRTDCTNPFCGDSIVDPNFDEDCDPPAAGACSSDCQEIPVGCGNGIVEPGAGEECDDGNNNSDIIPDACRTSCKLAKCGDNTQDTGEACDDGNNIDGDFCEANCSLPSCGNGIVDPLIGEECDDNNLIDNDGCDSDCSHADIIQVTAGIDFTCALLDTHNVRCWGQNNAGQLGYGNIINIGNNEFPFQATGGLGNGADVNIGGPVQQIDAGVFHTCALLQNGKVRCWGFNNAGRLGYGDTIDVGSTPERIPASMGDVALGGDAVQISSGNNFNCALMTTGAVRCWGFNGSGQLGYGNVTTIGDDETPAQGYANLNLPNNGDVNIGGTAIQISAGVNYVCALLTTGKVRCWGAGGFGRLGYGNTSNIGDNETPASVTAGANGTADVDLGGIAVQLATGGNQTCALLNTGKVRCWGAGLGASGITGYGNVDPIGDNESPAQGYANLNLPNNGDLNLGGTVVQLEAGPSHTCAVLDTAEVRCWGENGIGELGIGTINTIGDDSNEMPPLSVSVGAPVIAVTTGDTHTCALLETNRVRCWGEGGSGQLGYSNINNIGDNELPSSIYNNLPGNGDVQVAGPVSQ